MALSADLFPLVITIMCRKILVERSVHIEPAERLFASKFSMHISAFAQVISK